MFKYTGQWPKSLLLKILVFFCLSSFRGYSCQCPPTELSLKECEKYEIIFKGKIISVLDCGSKFGEALFEIEELYKGNATKTFTVLFECGGECAQHFYAGDEWIIYSRYKQINNAKMDWCSRSRKYFTNENEDFYKVNYGNDYYDEAKFLKSSFGLHRFLTENAYEVQGRNIRPNLNEFIFTLLASLAAVVLFYFLFNKYFR